MIDRAFIVKRVRRDYMVARRYSREGNYLMTTYAMGRVLASWHYAQGIGDGRLMKFIDKLEGKGRALIKPSP